MSRSGFWMHKRRCRHSTSLRQHVKRQWAHISSVCSFPQNVNICHACLVLLRWRRLIFIFRICAFHVWLALIRITLCFGCFERNLVQLVPRQGVACCNIAKFPFSAHYLSRGRRRSIWRVPRSANGHFRFQLCHSHFGEPGCVSFEIPMTSSWSSGECVRFGAGRSRVLGRVLPRPCKLVLQPSYQTHGVRKSCRELTQINNKKNKWNETWNCRNSVLALQDHCSYKAPTTNHHIKQSRFHSWVLSLVRELVKSICPRRELIAVWIRLGVNFSILHFTLVLWRELLSY